MLNANVFSQFERPEETAPVGLKIYLRA